MGQRDDIARWLAAFVAPDQLTELRALGVNGSETWAGWFRGDQLPAMAGLAVALEGRARGVYFTPNPLRAPPKGAATGEVRKRGKGECASDADVLERRWLLADVDPV